MAESSGGDDSIRHIWNSLPWNFENSLGDILIDRGNDQSRSRIPQRPVQFPKCLQGNPAALDQVDGFNQGNG